MYGNRYADVAAGDAAWQALPVSGGTTFAWDAASSYIKQPPFFSDTGETPGPVHDIRGPRPLAILGDSITTAHISPVSAIPIEALAGQHPPPHRRPTTRRRGT